MNRQNVGFILAGLGGLISVVVAVWKTNEPLVLLALLLVAIVVQQVRNRKSPITAGLLGLLGGCLVGYAVFVTNEPLVLLALLLVAIVVEQVS